MPSRPSAIELKLILIGFLVVSEFLRLTVIGGDSIILVSSNGSIFLLLLKQPQVVTRL
ncbi:hypothetical protein RINTHH_6470 [Richelia intracellularis HH01]|uniref:Uncharacterized protein n=1 Tax=Richelia intracellularis HH01 TaxID=1165094 RepID=M1WYD6_9NOST|nr:hypothetical protein RINTHH_6470 [Richelia intracellularis HH01]